MKLRLCTAVIHGSARVCHRPIQVIPAFEFRITGWDGTRRLAGPVAFRNPPNSASVPTPDLV